MNNEWHGVCGVGCWVFSVRFCDMSELGLVKLKNPGFSYFSKLLCDAIWLALPNSFRMDVFFWQQLLVPDSFLWAQFSSNSPPFLCLLLPALIPQYESRTACPWYWLATLSSNLCQWKSACI